jgi:YggT family protein
MNIFLAQLVVFIFRALELIVLVDIIISYFVSPFNQFRLILDRIVQPMLNPIRRILPATGMIDLSPLVLLILLQVLESIVSSLLRSIG